MPWSGYFLSLPWPSQPHTASTCTHLFVLSPHRADLITALLKALQKFGINTKNAAKSDFPQTVNLFRLHQSHWPCVVWLYNAHTRVFKLRIWYDDILTHTYTHSDYASPVKFNPLLPTQFPFRYSLSQEGISCLAMVKLTPTHQSGLLKGHLSWKYCPQPPLTKSASLVRSIYT